MPVHRLDSNPPLVRAPNTPASPPSPAPRVAPSPARTSHPRTKIRAPACEPPRIIRQSRSPSSNHPRASPTSRLRARPPESSEFDRLKTVSKSRVALDPFARARDVPRTSSRRADARSTTFTLASPNAFCNHRSADAPDAAGECRADDPGGLIAFESPIASRARSRSRPTRVASRSRVDARGKNSRVVSLARGARRAVARDGVRRGRAPAARVSRGSTRDGVLYQGARVVTVTVCPYDARRRDRVIRIARARAVALRGDETMFAVQRAPARALAKSARGDRCAARRGAARDARRANARRETRRSNGEVKSVARRDGDGAATTREARGEEKTTSED